MANKYKDPVPVEDYNSKDTGIDRIKAKIASPMVNNRFFVEFLNLPKMFQEHLNISGDLDLLNVLCHVASLPAKSLETTGYATFGPERQYPTGGVDYGSSVNLSFYCDPTFMDRFIIEEWLKMVHSSNIDTYSELDNSAGNSVMRFYKEYAQDCKFRIHVLKKDGSASLIYTFHECYPSSYDSMDLDAESENTLMKFSFDMSYRYFSVEYPTAFNELEMNQPLDGNFSLSGLNKGRRMFDAILEGLTVASRFNSKAGDILRNLSRVDSFITRAGTIGRDINPNFITERRRGG